MARLDTRIPMQVPNVLAQQAQVTQNNRLAAQSLGEGFNAVQRGMAAPLLREGQALQNQAGNMENMAREQQLLGGVLQGLAEINGDAQGITPQAQAAWAQARGYLVQNGVFNDGELPEALDMETFQGLSAIATMPTEELLKPTAAMQEYMFARDQGYGGSFLDYRTATKGGTSVNINTGSVPTPKLSPLGEGLTYAYNPDGTVQLDERGAPKVLAMEGTKGAREQAEAARAAADAASQSQAALSKATDSIATIDGLLNHPGFDRLYGAFDTRFGRVPIPDAMVPNIPGGDAANAEAYLSQIEGQAFLQAFESLKGGGQITEVEGTKATEAISRATNRGQSPEAAREALEELRAIAERGVEREIRKQNPELQFDGVKIMNGMVFISRNGEWFQKQ